MYAPYPENMMESIKKVEATRAQRMATEPRRLSADEKDALLKKFHPDYNPDAFAEIKVGPNKGQKAPLELAEMLHSESRLLNEKIDLNKIDYDVDVLVIGGGGAGSSCAIEAHNAGANVMIVTKLRIGDANTMMAEGGIQAADKENDSPVQHYLDCFGGGHFAAKPELVKRLVMEAPDAIKWLNELGVEFDKDADGIKNALQTSRRLGQLLSNMQDGMRSYFEELSQKKNFIGIQKVLVEEINNRDSKKYAILTTTDSFYRYKEAVKELVSQILRENDQKREQLVKERTGLVEGTVTSKRNQYRLEYCESASQLVYQVEREFDLIEKKYNKLIEQKTVFAKRALARIHYILQEGSSDEDHIVKLINLLDHHANSSQVLEQMRDRIRVGTQFKNITDRSFYNRKNAEDAGFHPIAMEKHNEETQMTDFVPKPLYTKKQLQEFRQKNIVDGRFVTDEQTIQSVEDLEKLLFLWQEETDDTKQEETVHIDGELKGEYGFVFSKLVIDAKKGEKK